MFMNESEIEDALEWTPEDSNLERGARVLYRLMRWTNENSDGWPYWQKPSNAAKRLQELLYAAHGQFYRGDIEDVTETQLKAALTPIKAFLTRRGVAHSEVF